MTHEQFLEQLVCNHKPQICRECTLSLMGVAEIEAKYNVNEAAIGMFDEFLDLIEQGHTDQLRDALTLLRDLAQASKDSDDAQIQERRDATAH